MIPFNIAVFLITFAIVLWLMQDPDENTKIFLNIPSIAVLLFSLIVLGTDWSEYGDGIDAIRMFLGGLVAIPYVTASGFAYFLRVYSYMWKLTTGRHKQKKRQDITLDTLLKGK